MKVFEHWTTIETDHESTIIDANRDVETGDIILIFDIREPAGGCHVHRVACVEEREEGYNVLTTIRISYGGSL